MRKAKRIVIIQPSPVGPAWSTGLAAHRTGKYKVRLLNVELSRQSFWCSSSPGKDKGRARRVFFSPPGAAPS
ncbi:MAG: hypothetical protein AABN33_00425 [Acidobacteriota bacterium]